MRLPHKTTKKDGSPRRAGFEFEFAGLEPREAGDVVATVLGGTLTRENAFSYVVEGTRHGDAGVELDAAVLKQRRYMDALEELGVEVSSAMIASLENALLGVSATLVPCEVVLPPIPLDELDVLEELREALRERSAKGTRASLAYAFGMHINVEPPDLEVGTLVAYLRAFVLLYDHLRKQSEVDITRAVSPYIDKFPAEYVRLVADPDYAPADVGELAVDYLRHNPTRNRPLDMLPLLAHLDEDAVRLRALDSEAELIKPRPALHYRLPNCRIDEPRWTVGAEWENWLLVERLAADPEALAALGREFVDTPGFPMELFFESWAKRMGRWVDG